MRIGFFTDTYTPQINGVVTSICLFKDALEARGHEVYVFAPKPEHADDGDHTVRFRSMPFAFQPEMRLASPFSIEALRRVDKIDLDIIHSHDPFSIGLFGLNVARRHKIPYVHTYHTLYPDYVHYVWETRLTKKLAERLSREFCEQCSSIIAPSTKVEQYLRAWGVTVPVEIIATGVDVERYSRPDPDRVEELAELIDLQPDERVLLFMGRLGKEKNVELLLHALWHSRHPHTRLIIGGDGPNRAALEQLTEELGLTGRVSFMGYLKGADAVAAYHVADAFAFASTTETQGLVIGEAMAAGLPVIAVEDHAVEDFVINGRTGLVVPGRAEDLGVAIDGLLADDAQLLSYSEAGLRRAACFSIEHQAERLEMHYTHAIESHRPRRRFARLALPRARRKDA
jgi:1,2-diacylglycerol 3-alpha-glucosyltransferase